MTNRLNQIFLGLLLIWVPLAFFVRAADGFTLTKELIGLLAVVYFVLATGMNSLKIFRQPLVLALLLFVVWMVGDSYGIALVPSQVGEASFHLWLLLGTVLGVVYAASQGFSYERLLRYAVGTGAFMALYSFFQVLGLDHYDWNTRFETRAFGTLGNPDYLGGYLVTLLPVAFVLTLRTYGQMPFAVKTLVPATSSQKSWFWLRAMTLLLFVGLLLTRVIGSFLALGLVTVFLGLAFLFPTGRDLFLKNRRYVLITLGVLVVGAGVYVYRHGGLAALSAKQISVEQRIDNYRVAEAIWKDHLWTGVGLGQIGTQYPRYQAAAYNPSDYPNHPFTYSEHVHNDFLQFGVEGGAIGLALFAAVLLAYVLSLIAVFNNAAVNSAAKGLLLASTTGLVAVIGQSLSNFPLQVAPTAILFGLFLAAPLALQVPVTPKTQGFSAIQQGVIALGLMVVLIWGTHSMAVSVALRNSLGETNLGKKELAAQFSDRLTRLAPKDPKTWRARGAALALDPQKLDDAYAAYVQATTLNPNDVESLAQMANLRVQQGKFDEGLTLSERALALTPNYYGPVWTRAVCLFQLKHYAESATGFESFLVYAPNDAQTYLNLGVCYIQLKRKADAIAAWKKSYELDPNNGQSLVYLKSVGVSVKIEQKPL